MNYSDRCCLNLSLPFHNIYFVILELTIIGNSEQPAMQTPPILPTNRPRRLTHSNTLHPRMLQPLPPVFQMFRVSIMPVTNVRPCARTLIRPCGRTAAAPLQRRGRFSAASTARNLRPHVPLFNSRVNPHWQRTGVTETMTRPSRPFLIA